MEKLILKVQMLGGFSVSYNGNTIISEKNRNNKVTHLFQYLLVKYNQAIRQDELIGKLFYDSDEYDDPEHTLKNLIYRLRKLLAASGLPEREYIYFQKHAYGLCADIEYDLDVEHFENAVNNARSESLSEEDRLDLCLGAISVYDGDFLPKSSDMPWVLPRAVRYQEMFFYCVQTVYEILLKKQNLSFLINLLEKALSLYPYEEQFHILHISCLYSLNRIQDAINQYNCSAALLFDELGVSPSEEMQELYIKIAETLNMPENSIENIRTSMNEESMEKGAYFCNFQSFINTYHFIVRQAERSGQSSFLMLETIKQTGNSAQSMGSNMKKIADAFHNAIHVSLRRGDIYTRYSPSQFIVMLIDINLENCKIVANRINENFNKQIKDKNIKLHSQIMSAIDIDSIMKS